LSALETLPVRRLDGETRLQVLASVSDIEDVDESINSHAPNVAPLAPSDSLRTLAISLAISAGFTLLPKVNFAYIYFSPLNLYVNVINKYKSDPAVLDPTCVISIVK
jgi:hypothetical protein